MPLSLRARRILFSSLSIPQGKNKNPELVEEHVVFVAFPRYQKAFLIKSTLTVGSSWLLRVVMDSSMVDSCTSLQTAGLASWEGAVRASDTGQRLPLTSDRSTAEGELPAAWPPGPSC